MAASFYGGLIGLVEWPVGLHRRQICVADPTALVLISFPKLPPHLGRCEPVDSERLRRAQVPAQEYPPGRNDSVRKQDPPSCQSHLQIGVFL
jgi:hypothetical protein